MLLFIARSYISVHSVQQNIVHRSEIINMPIMRTRAKSCESHGNIRIISRTLYTNGLLEGDEECAQNAIITNADCRPGIVRRACMRVSTKRNTKEYKNIRID